MQTATLGYLVRNLSEAPSVPCPCGVSTRILTGADGSPASLHVTSITDSVRHYHRETTEVYYVLEGLGKIELNGTWRDVAPGTRHRVVSDVGLKTIVFALPAFNPADEWFD